MMIIGCDYHPGFQQIACVNTETGELSERRLSHREEAEQFYRNLKGRGLTVRVGMEASRHARWFERLLTELQFELKRNPSTRAKWRSSPSACKGVLDKCLTPPTLLEMAIYRQ